MLSNVLTRIVKPFHKKNLLYSTEEIFDSWYLPDGVKLLNFCLTSTRQGHWACQEPITWSVQLLPYWLYVTVFSQNGLFLDYLFAGNRLLELTLSDTIHEKRRKKMAA